MAGPREKAFAINLDGSRYGTIAEIGGGQEVARWFFRAGGAAGTVAETISAYDMAVSDHRYGRATRYVSRERLEAMLAREYDHLLKRLGASRSERTAFFAFADTVATRSYSHDSDGSGWLGVRFQAAPGAEPSDVVLHTRLRDRNTERQQEALGVLGINLLYAAFNHHGDPTALLGGLMDDLEPARLEIDMVKLSGPAFAGIDDRLVALQVVELGLSRAAMVSASGEVVQPSDVLYKRPILVQRGRWNPVTNLAVDIITKAREAFLAGPAANAEPIVMLEIGRRDLGAGAQLGHEDFLERAAMVEALGHPLLVTDYARFFEMADHLAEYTSAPLGIALGMPTLREIAAFQYYADLAGGLLEALGRLFKDHVTMYVYPERAASGAVAGLADLVIEPVSQHLVRFLIDAGKAVPLSCDDPQLLDMSAGLIRELIAAGDPRWKTMVPPAVAALVERTRAPGPPPPR
jgi:hypothetical protein